MHAESIALPRPHVGQVAVPAETRDLRKIESCFFSVLVKETKLDAIRDLGEQ
jgi:hypothetical protein